GNNENPTTGINVSEAKKMPNAIKAVRPGCRKALSNQTAYVLCIIFCTTRSIAFPSSEACGFNILLDKKGTTNNAINIEPITDAITAVGILRIKSPANSGMNINGRNAITNVTVQPTTANAI